MSEILLEVGARKSEKSDMVEILKKILIWGDINLVIGLPEASFGQECIFMQSTEMTPFASLWFWSDNNFFWKGQEDVSEVYQADYQGAVNELGLPHISVWQKYIFSTSKWTPETLTTGQKLKMFENGHGCIYEYLSTSSLRQSEGLFWQNCTFSLNWLWYWHLVTPPWCWLTSVNWKDGKEDVHKVQKGNCYGLTISLSEESF